MNRRLLVFFGIEGHVAIDRNPGPRNNILLLRLFQGISKELVTIYSSIHYPACYTFGLQCQTPIQTHACQGGGGSLCHFYNGLRYYPAGTRTHDLPHESRTR